MADEVKMSKEMAIKCLIKQCKKSERAFEEISGILTAYDDLLCFQNGTATKEQIIRMPVSMAILESPEAVMNGIIKQMTTIRQCLCAISQIGDITEWGK